MVHFLREGGKLKKKEKWKKKKECYHSIETLKQIDTSTKEEPKNQGPQLSQRDDILEILKLTVTF